MQQRGRSAPYGWIGFFALLAVVAFIGFSRHQSAPPVANATVPLYGPGGSAQDRAESADVQTGLRATTAPVDANAIVRAFELRGDMLTVTVDGPAFAALVTDDRQRLFDETADLWSKAYRAHRGGKLDRSLTMDFVEGANELVHHRLLDPQ